MKTNVVQGENRNHEKGQSNSDGRLNRRTDCYDCNCEFDQGLIDHCLSLAAVVPPSGFGSKAPAYALAGAAGVPR
jgi:hypothetical protein